MSLLPEHYNKAISQLKSYIGSQITIVACELDIFELLADSQRSYTEISESTDLPPENTRRFMKGLVLFGLVNEIDKGLFSLTEMGKCFLKRNPASLRGFALQAGYFYKAWANLRQSLISGKTGFELEFGQKIFDYIEKSTQFELEFNNTMAMNANLIFRDLCKAIDFSSIDEVVDIGGNTGALARLLLLKHPNLTTIVFDRETVINSAASKSNEGNKVTLQAGDFFVSVPPTDGFYILSHVLHDWQDTECIKILNNCRKNMDENNSLIVIERIMPEIARSQDQTVEFDLNMLMITGGKERTLEEYELLFDAADLRLVNVVSTNTGNSILITKIKQIRQDRTELRT